MKIIANETLYARKCLEQGFIDKKQPYKSIRTVIRYLVQVQGIRDIMEVHDLIKEYIKNTGREVKFNMDTIKKYFYSDDPYNELEYVYISKKELDIITNKNYPHSWKKVLFSMLVIYKTKNALFRDDNNRINAEMSIIMKDAHTTLGVEQREEMLAKFEEDGLVDMPNGGKQAKYFYLNYIDNEPEEIGIIVEDFDDFYLYFEQYVKGGILKHCENCGKLFLVKKTTGHGKIRYCEKCAIIKEKESRQRDNLKQRLKKK